MSNTNNKYEVLFKRNPQNPILTADNWPYPVHCVFNAGAARLNDGTTLLLCRVGDRRGFSHLCAARSKNGLDDWQIDPKPTLRPEPDKYPEEMWGIEDPRITWVPSIGKFVVTYVGYSEGGPCICLALTEDFVAFERLGVVMPPADKDGALMPHKIGACWAMVHRPVATVGEHMWISYSPDLRHWGSHRIILRARPGGWWDATKVGLSPPPIETPKGWLIIYHGVQETPGGFIYRLGLSLFDLKTPERCLLRGDEWVFAPEAPYERMGHVHDIVFPCGYTLDEDGDTLSIYYGASDSCIALATASIARVLEWLERHGRPPSAV